MRRILAWGAATVAVAGLCVCSSVAADAGKERDALAVLSDMKVKKLSERLKLDAEQQKKLRAILDEEGTKVRAVQTNKSLTYEERYQKQAAIQAETREKVKPVLTEQQRAEWDAAIANTAKKKPAKKAEAKAEEKAKDQKPAEPKGDDKAK